MVEEDLEEEVLEAQSAPPPRPHVRVAWEPWEALWPGINELAEIHASEVEPTSPRRFKVDAQRMAVGCRLGLIRIYTARIDGELAGYCSWNLSWDLESEGLPIATQGAWFVKPGAPWGLAAKLFMESLEGLRGIGIQCVFPHHRVQGRGAQLGKFFTRLGAVRIQETYMLWIGKETPDA